MSEKSKLMEACIRIDCPQHNPNLCIHSMIHEKNEYCYVNLGRCLKCEELNDFLGEDNFIL